MGEPALPSLFGARQYAVTNPQRAFPSAFDNAQFGNGNAFRFPPLRDRDQLVAADIDDFQHCNLGHAAHLMESPSGSEIDDPLIGHILEQRFQRNLIAAMQTKGARDLALASGLTRLLDKFEDLLAGRQALKAFFGQLGL